VAERNERYFREFDGTFSKEFNEVRWLKELEKALKDPLKLTEAVKEATGESPSFVQKILGRFPVAQNNLIKLGIKAAESFFFDSKAGRFAFATLRRFVPSNIMTAISKYQRDDGARKARDAAQRLIEAKTNLSEWQRSMRTILKSQHLKEAMMAKGGLGKLTPKDYLAVSKELKKEYRYLRNLAQEIKDGKVSEKQFLARTQMYVNKARVSGEIMARENALTGGFTLMERILDGGGNSCAECRQYASEGPRPIGELPLPTEACSCRSYCRCSVRYYRGDEG
jgi:hypothetical protein